MAESTTQTDHQFVIDGIKRIFLRAERVGDIKSAIRAITHLSRILGMVPTALARKAKEVAEKATEVAENVVESVTQTLKKSGTRPYLDKRGRYLGIELPMPLHTKKFKHGPMGTT